MDAAQIEELYNKTFSGLTLYYRDTEIDQQFVDKYKPGQILVEKGMTDVTWKGGGLEKNTRYLIASAFGKDLSMFNTDAEKYGMIVLMPHSFFKVLDVYKIGDKTQVFLLNIPVDGIEVFETSMTIVEEEIIDKARESFNEKHNAQPLHELQEKGWQERTSFPIGMNDDGNFFY